MTESIDFLGEWPKAELETLSACPVCHSKSHALLHQRVRDWSFFSAPGDWSYWRCNDCESVFLNPRPCESSIGKAYKTYYTHRATGGFGLAGLKARWKNERLTLRLGREIAPRLHLPTALHPWVARKAARMGVPFGWTELASLKPGVLMDVGCGSGAALALARQLGWTAQGLELDEQAVKAARQSGLDVHQSGYEGLIEFPNAFDAIVCSHVIEHVFDPVRMISLIHSALRPGGVLLLSTPNARSDVHAAFGKHWRGLEAPRHLVLFSQPTLVRLLEQAGFGVSLRSSEVLQTVRESVRISRNRRNTNSSDRATARRTANELVRTPNGQDFIEIVAVKQDQTVSH